MRPVALFDCRVGPAALEALAPVLSGGQLAAGPAVQALESQLQAYLGGTRPVVAMGDMTHALTLALQLAGVGPGNEVLTLAYNCLSSNTAIPAAGARPVWVDIDPDRVTMSLEDARAALTPRTRAVVVYHVAGYPADLAAWRAFCDEHGLALIEDANNALGARWQGQPVGSVGDFAVFSFYANRQVNGIEGAALVCPDADTARKAQQLRRFGIDMASFRDRLGEIDPASDVPRIGMSSPMNHVNATLALHHLDSLEKRLQRNRAHAAELVSRLRATTTPVSWPAAAQPAFWVLLVLCRGRDEMLAKLKAAGVQCSKLHQPNDHYTGFGATARDLPGTRAFMQRVLGLPCGWWLEPANLDAIVTVMGGS